MKIVFVLLVVSFISLIFTPPYAHAQMMMNTSATTSANPIDIQNQQQDEATGKKLFDQYQNNQITCDKLTDSDFEKIGEYTMSQMFGGNTPSHVAMNERIKQIHGTTGEEQMHVQIGKSVTSCNSTAQNIQNTTPRGGNHMMGWNGSSMMNGNFALFGVFAFVVWLVILIDLILVGIWLWQQISLQKRK